MLSLFISALLRAYLSLNRYLNYFSILDIDRPSQETFGSGNELLPAPIPEARLETVHRRPHHSPNVESIKSPSGRVRNDPSWLPSAPVDGRPSSPRMMVGGKVGAFGIGSHDRRGSRQDNLPMVPITTTAPTLTPVFAHERNTSYTKTFTTRVETFSVPSMPSKAAPIHELAEVGTGYDRVLKKLVKKKKRDHSKYGKKTVVYPRSTNVSRDIQVSGSEVDGDVGDECEIVTMGSISLDGLVMDEPNAAEYDFMYQRLMVESLAQNITTAATCRPSGGRGRRRSSVIRFTNTSPAGMMYQRRLSRDQDASSSSFHLALATSSDLHANEDRESPNNACMLRGAVVYEGKRRDIAAVEQLSQ